MPFLSFANVYVNVKVLNIYRYGSGYACLKIPVFPFAK